MRVTVKSIVVLFKRSLLIVLKIPIVLFCIILNKRWRMHGLMMTMANNSKVNLPRLRPA